jgi:hypothetical protein
MRRFSHFLAAWAILSSCCYLQLVSCKLPTGTSINSEVVSTLEAPEALNTELKITDFNSYEENDTVICVGLIDHLGSKSCKPLIGIEYLDEAGVPLTLKGTVFRTTDTVYASNRHMPARGRTAFMHRFPKSRITGGKYSTARVRGLGADELPTLTAIIFENQGFYKSLKSEANLKDTSATAVPIQKEVSWVGSGSIFNPFDIGVGSPKVELWIYGKDNKLYVVNALTPGIDQNQILMQDTGPMKPTERRPVSLKVMVDQMPKYLRDSGIGRIDVQAFQ